MCGLAASEHALSNKNRDITRYGQPFVGAVIDANGTTLVFTSLKSRLGPSTPDGPLSPPKSALNRVSPTRLRMVFAAFAAKFAPLPNVPGTYFTSTQFHAYEIVNEKRMGSSTDAYIRHGEDDIVTEKRKYNDAGS